MFDFFKKKEETLDELDKNIKDISVYLVDDDPDIITFLKRHIEKRWGFAVSTFKSVQEVTDEIKSSKVLPNLVISDVRMPDKSGLSLHFALKDTPIIFITALGGDDIEDSEYTIIGKPISKNHLDELIVEKLQL